MEYIWEYPVELLITKIQKFAESSQMKSIFKPNKRNKCVIRRDSYFHERLFFCRLSLKINIEHNKINKKFNH